MIPALSGEGRGKRDLHTTGTAATHFHSCFFFRKESVSPWRLSGGGGAREERLRTIGHMQWYHGNSDLTTLQHPLEALEDLLEGGPILRTGSLGSCDHLPTSPWGTNLGFCRPALLHNSGKHGAGTKKEW